jgi:hypothetical protein
MKKSVKHVQKVGRHESSAGWIGQAPLFVREYEFQYLEYDGGPDPHKRHVRFAVNTDVEAKKYAEELVRLLAKTRRGLKAVPRYLRRVSSSLISEY